MRLYYVFFLVALLLGVGAAAQQENGGTLEVRIKDHRDAIGDFSRLDIVIEAISISRKSGLYFWRTGWKALKATAEKLDLTSYVGPRAVTVFRDEVAPGLFEAVHLKLGAVEGMLKRDKTRPAIKNLVGPIKLSFSIKPKETTVIVLDLTVIDMSDHPPRGYELQLQGYELYNNGKLTEKIPPG